MQPRKRQRADELDREYAETPRDLIANYFPELNTREKRIQYFQAFEFPEKQVLLKDYWEKTLVKFFTVNFDGCVVPWRRVREQFHVAGSYPLGLASVVLKLWDERKVTLLKDDSEQELVLPIISDYVVPKKPVGAFESIARLFKKPVVCLTPDTVIVHNSTFRALYNNIVERLGRVFPQGPMLPEDVFDDNFNQEFQDIKDTEKRLAVFALFSLQVLYRLTRLGQRFVCLRAEQVGEAEIERLTNAQILEKKIAGIEVQEQQVMRAAQELREKALALKREGRASESKRVLNDYLLKKKRLEKLNAVRLFLSNNLNRVVTSKEHAEATEIIAKTTEILRKAEGSMDKMFENLQAMEENDLRNAQLDDMLKRAAGTEDLEKDYEALDDEQNQELLKLLTEAKEQYVKGREPEAEQPKRREEPPAEEKWTVIRKKA